MRYISHVPFKPILLLHHLGSPGQRAGGPPHLHLPSRAAHLNLPIPAQLICIRGWCVAGLGAVRGGRGLDNWGGECQNCDDRGDGRLSAAAHAPHSSVTSRASNKPSRTILNHKGEESTFTFKTPLRHYAKQTLTHITHGK